MLNKDQYNQDEYNDYYRQEVEGSELGSSSSKENKFVGKFIALLSLLALAIASYFGYKAFSETSISDNNHTTNVPAKETTSSLPTSVQEKSTAIESPKVKIPIDKMPENKTIQEKGVEKNSIEKKPLEEKPVEKKALEEKNRTTQSKITKVVESQSKMSPEEVAAVVAAVMKQMSQTKSNNSTTVETPNKQDLNLMNKLTNLEVDPVSKDLMEELKKVNVTEDTKVENSDKQIDVYNKVNVENTTTDIDTDTLSKLSDEINSVITKGSTSETTSNNTDKIYTESLKDEVDVRKNEMRIIVVREGDTLGKIAARAYGNASEFKRIYEANPEITRPDHIYIGQKLRIPN